MMFIAGFTMGAATAGVLVIVACAIWKEVR